MQEEKSYTMIDLFAGAGGLSVGFAEAGFKIVAANDFDHDAANTFKHNHPDTIFFDGPIENIQEQALLEKLGLEVGELDILAGGPPCQAFSVYNHQRGFHDERSGLFREYLRMVRGLQPKVIVMENVTGMKSLEKGRALDEISQSLDYLGYTVETSVLKAEKYGVPQERRRIIFIGVRKGNRIIWPEPTHYSADEEGELYGQSLKRYVSVWEAIGDLPVLKNGEGTEESEYLDAPFSDYQKLMRNGATKLYNHVAPTLEKINLERMKYIPQGGSWRDIPDQLLPAGMKRAKRSDHTKRYGRLRPNGISSTILTKCDLHWGPYIHPFQDRALTVREAARFQSFPDWFVFTGSRVEQYRQVGNAVPPLLALSIANTAKVMLSTIGENTVVEAKG